MGHAQVTEIIELDISGMKCGGCAKTLVRRMEQSFPGTRFSADAVTGTGLLVPGGPSNLAEQLQFLREQGYAVALHSDTVRRSVARERVNLAVAFFCFANAMLLACIEYFAAPNEISPAFLFFIRLCSALLATASLGYAAQNLWRGALTAVRARQASVDVSVGFALVIAYGYSLLSLVRPSLAPFFDSITATVFFILLGRFFQNRFLRKNSQSLEKLSQKTFPTARRIHPEAEELVDTTLLAPGDLLRVLPGEVVPVSSRARTDGTVSLDLINGESEPVPVRAGDAVPAGAVGLVQPLQVEALENGLDSQLKKIQWRSFRLSLEKSRLSRQSDRMASVFFLFVVAVSTACLFSTLSLGTEEAISRMVAILLVACPCAFSVAVPLATLRGAYAASLHSVLFRNASAIESTALANQVVFDKTGTLSETRLRVEAEKVSEAFTPRLRNLVQAACLQSQHPSARALAEYLSPSNTRGEVVQSFEIPGQGLEVILKEGRFRIGSARFCHAENDGKFDLFVSAPGPRTIAAFRITETPIEGIGHCVAALKELGLSLSILSGDSAAKVKQFSKNVGIQQWRAEQSPEAKVALLKEMPGSIMVGNGFNDAMAISAAHTGVSVAGSNSVAFEVSDVHLMKPDLKGLAPAIRISRQTLKHIRQAFTFSVVYNSAAIGLAFAGFLTPVVAAILMPLNGIIVSGIASRRLS